MASSAAAEPSGRERGREGRRGPFDGPDVEALADDPRGGDGERFGRKPRGRGGRPAHTQGVFRVAGAPGVGVAAVGDDAAQTAQRYVPPRHKEGRGLDAVCA